MLYREIIAVCSQIHTKHINILRGQNVEFMSVQPGGAYGYHWAWKQWDCYLLWCGSFASNMEASRFCLSAWLNGVTFNLTPKRVILASVTAAQSQPADTVRSPVFHSPKSMFFFLPSS